MDNISNRGFNTLHKALNILYQQEKDYGFPSGLKKYDESTVDITFDSKTTNDPTTVRIFIDEERVVEL